jgi:NAD(P)-dependent dehydrogenase (short-subunit alcohol dehydrogenase family)
VPKPLSEQVIVITGASSGIGRRTAVAAAAEGARVVLAARNAEDLEEVAAEIRRAGGTALAVPTDVSDYAQVLALAGRAVDELGRIDCWINNAAVSLYGAFDEVSLDDFRRVLEVNFMGQVHGAKAALPWLEETGGALICVGSALSDRGVPLQGAYCASKHALKGWLDALRVELRHAGSRVRVTLVKPSSINTPLFNKAKTLLGVMPQPIPPIYEPELAADVLLRAAEHGDRDVYVGGSGRLFALLESLSPRLLDLHQLWTGFDAQRTDWPKGSDAPDNLWDAVEHDGGVRGDFTRRAKSRSAYNFLDAHATAVLAVGAGVLAGALAVRRWRGGDGGPGGGTATRGAKARRPRLRVRERRAERSL